MRILWLSNAPWAASGYGEQTALFVPRLRDQGHEISVLCNYGLQGRETHWNGVTCYPSDGQWGNVNLPMFAEELAIDQVIVLCDAFVLKPSVWPEGLTAAVWAPVDHYPIPAPVLGVLQDTALRPIAMSRFAEQLMREAELDPIYVPHGVDTTRFRPQRELRDAVRDELGIPRDVFLAGMVAANKGNASVPRKGFPQAFLAFSRFARTHEDAWLYAHTEAQPFMGGGGGLNLDLLAEISGIPQGRLRFPHAKAWQLGIPAQAVAFMYQAFDVLLMPSMGEGFGIQLLEAQACGCPVIASDHSAMTELTAAGWLVHGDPWWDELQQAFFIVPSIDGIVAALEAAYEAREDQRLRAAAVEHAAAYDADLVADQYWRPALAQLAGAEPEPELEPELELELEGEAVA